MNAKIALWLTWAGIAGFAAGTAWAVTTGPWSPNNTPGCRIVDASPTYTAGQLVALTCDVNGKLRTGGSP